MKILLIFQNFQVVASKLYTFVVGGIILRDFIALILKV